MSTLPSLSLFDTRYLSAAGLTFVVYDHLLLLGQEVQHIWTTKSSWFKWLFLYNYYSVPVYLIVNSLALGPYPGNLSTQFCKNWFTTAAVLSVSSVGIVNIFVAQRIYVLWGFNKSVLKLVTFGIITAYTSSFIVSAIGVAQSFPFIAYDPIFRTCTAQRVAKLVAVGFGLPLCLELVNFILLCCNALHRPRHLHTYIVKQLYLDGVVYFWIVAILRMVNIIAVAGAFSQENTLLFSFFLWAIVPAVVHRMILTLNDNAGAENDMDDETEYLGLYVRGPWLSQKDPSPVVLRTFPSNNPHFNVEVEFEETYSITDSVF